MYTNSLGDWMLGGREAGKRALEMSSDSLDIIGEVKMRLSNPIFPNSWTAHTNSNIIIKKQIKFYCSCGVVSVSSLPI